MARPIDKGRTLADELTDRAQRVSAIDVEEVLTLRVAGRGIFDARPVPLGCELILGRAADADLRIEDPSISRKHARLRTGPPLSIEDLGSSNGTRVGDRQLRPGEIRVVSPGEVITLGAVMLFVEPGSAPALPSAAGPREPLPTISPVGAEDAGAPALVVHAPAMRALYELVDRVAVSTISVLLLGETGVGKEVMAEAIHRRSPRASQPFLRLNCAALSETLIESELFGHEKGAFTGAVQPKPGLLESADGGTVFLDEVGELPLPLQAKLLRVIEERRVMRVGGLRARDIDVRFISATNRDLDQEVARHAFRRDLYFRLNGISLLIPPLRERTAEIEPLARSFLLQASRRLGRATPPRLSPEALARLLAHPFPGNIRELRNTIERATILCRDDVITADQLLLAPLTGAAPTPTAPPPPLDPGAVPQPTTLRDDLEAIERRRIIDALEQCAGNQTQAARLLGISRGTLLSRLSAYGLPRPRGGKTPAR